MDPQTVQGDERQADGSGSASRDISRGMVAIYKDYLGRGPTVARTSISDEMVVTVLQDSLTKAEQKLHATDRGDMVRQIRREFQDAMREDIKALVERVLGREARCMLSDHSPSPDFAVEVLILGR